MCINRGDDIVRFGDYYLGFESFYYDPDEKRGWIKHYITHKDRREISENEINIFLKSYFDNIGKWENILYVGEEIIKAGLEIMKGFGFSNSYQPQWRSEFKKKYSFSIEKIPLPSDVISILINVENTDDIDKDEFIPHNGKR